ncbi:MAG TPA: MBL fold metallo-hydrolase, partial [bacterium]|nr:MBL fold metallo-hydrolase [bacterium]
MNRNRSKTAATMSPGWEPIPGARQAWLYSYLRKPLVFSCNSYLIRTPGALAVIDPGGLPEQTEAILAVLKNLLREKPRPVYVLLTHCHVDHALEAVSNAKWRELTGTVVAIHEIGAESLRAADRRITQAQILGQDLAPFAADIPLRPVPGGNGHGGLARTSLALDSGNTMEVYAVAGHSPDSVCFRLGSALFCGDLLAATAPLIAGAPGWNREELMASARGLVRLYARGGIETCYPGHGRPLRGEAIETALERVVEEAADLEGIEVADAGRVNYISDYAQELFAEMGAVFALIQKKIHTLARRLRQFEEWGAAREIARVLDSKQVAQLLRDFRNFRERYLAGEVIEVQVALKAIQLIRGIGRLLETEGLDRIVEPHLLRLAATLVGDFIDTSKGLGPPEDAEATDPEALFAAVRAEVTRRPGTGASLEEIPDDPEGFREYLIGVLVADPACRRLALEFRACGKKLSPIRIDRRRFL